MVAHCTPIVNVVGGGGDEVVVVVGGVCVCGGVCVGVCGCVCVCVCFYFAVMRFLLNVRGCFILRELACALRLYSSHMKKF